MRRQRAPSGSGLRPAQSHHRREQPGIPVHQREFTNPTGLLQEVMRKEICPLQQRIEKLVRELLGAADRRPRGEVS